MDIEARMREVEREIISRRPEHSVDLALDRMTELVGLLGDPQRACPVIHITGTNGKTSTARMTDALLRAAACAPAGSPARTWSRSGSGSCIDGAPISPERFVAAYDEIIPYVSLVDERHPVAMSFFEVLTGMAFAVFADTPVDVVVLEVGVGGRLDCTNVADGVVAVVTPISIDHTRLLGNTVEEIAAEKAGIIKPGAVAVLAQQPLGAAEVLLRYAVEVGATVAREGVEFGVLSREQAVGGQQLALRGLRGTYEDVYLPLFGAAPGGQRGLRAGRGRGVRRGLGRRRTAARRGPGPGGVREGQLARAAGGHQAQPHHHHRRRAQPGRDGRDRGRDRGGVHLRPPDRRLRGQRRQGRAGHARRAGAAAHRHRGDPQLLRPVDGSRARPRSWPPRSSARTGSSRADRLDDAIETAVALADEAVAETGPGTGGVLITGSVITAGDARRLLGPAGGELPPEPSASQPSRHSFTAAELS